MGTYARRSPLRFLAPVAILAFGVALLVIVSSSNGGGNGKSPSASAQEKTRDLGTAAKKPRTSRTANGQLPKRTYVVKNGDTLASISERVGIPVAKLMELNPAIDPQALSAGQRIKLRE
jgi:LysM repeat protein